MKRKPIHYEVDVGDWDDEIYTACGRRSQDYPGIVTTIKKDAVTCQHCVRIMNDTRRR